MSNRQQHLDVGVLVGGVAGLIQVALRGGEAEEYLGGFLGGAVGGALGALAPDKLEPPTHPRHRGALHSVAFCGGGALASAKAAPAWGQYWAEQRRRASPGNKLLLAAFEGFGPGVVTGYASHLALDSTTPAGLPLLGIC